MKPIHIAIIIPAVIAFVIMTFLLFNCSFNPPKQTIVLNLAAQNSGYFLAQEKPDLAQEILKVTQGIPIEHFTVEGTFHAWVNMVMQKLELDPFLQMNFKELIKLVNIEIELSERDEELVEMLYQVIRNFVIGIEAGDR